MNIQFRALRRFIGLLPGLLLSALVAACSGVPSAEQHIPPTSTIRHAVATIAIHQVGDRYQAHTAGPKAYDAAGLMYYAYRRAGAQLPRGLIQQLDTGKPIVMPKAQPADLLFFQIDGADHRPRKTVGMLISQHEMVIAIPGTQDNSGGVQLVNLSDAYWRQRLVGVIRVLS